MGSASLSALPPSKRSGVPSATVRDASFRTDSLLPPGSSRSLNHTSTTAGLLSERSPAAGDVFTNSACASAAGKPAASPIQSAKKAMARSFNRLVRPDVEIRRYCPYFANKTSSLFPLLANARTPGLSNQSSSPALTCTIYCYKFTWQINILCYRQNGG